jgi:hypothetical protein
MKPAPALLLGLAPQDPPRPGCRLKRSLHQVIGKRPVPAGQHARQGPAGDAPAGFFCPHALSTIDSAHRHDQCQCAPARDAAGWLWMIWYARLPAQKSTADETSGSRPSQ